MCASSLTQAFNGAKAHRLERGDDQDISDELADVAMDSDEDSVMFPPPTRGRGRGGRGRGGRGRGRGGLSFNISQKWSEDRSTEVHSSEYMFQWFIQVCKL